MQYTKSGSPVTPSRRRSTLSEQIEREVLPSLPGDSWRETTEVVPFAEDTSIPTIVAACLPCCDGAPRSDAVYVLECRPNQQPQATAARFFERVDQPWLTETAGAQRLIYVGVTANLLRRLDEHLNHPGETGAHFTTVYPPLRILDVSWYSSYAEATRAEQLTAHLLRERYPDDYIYQA